MKKGKWSLILALFLLVVAFLPIHIYADEPALIVKVTTDKALYEVGEEAKITLNVTNEFDYDVPHVIVSFTFAGEVTLSKGIVDNAIGRVPKNSSIAPITLYARVNKDKELVVNKVVNPNPKLPDTDEETTTTTYEQEEITTKQPGIETSTTTYTDIYEDRDSLPITGSNYLPGTASSGSSFLPATGERSNKMAIVGLILVWLGLLIFFMKSKGKVKVLAKFLLVLVPLVSLIVFAIVSQAADETGRTITAKITTIGLPGEPGTPGAKGADGTNGSKGDKGETGSTGPQGPRGLAGANGAEREIGWLRAKYPSLDVARAELSEHGKLADMEEGELILVEGKLYFLDMDADPRDFVELPKDTADYVGVNNYANGLADRVENLEQYTHVLNDDVQTFASKFFPGIAISAIRMGVMYNFWGDTYYREGEVLNISEGLREPKHINQNEEYYLITSHVYNETLGHDSRFNAPSVKDEVAVLDKYVGNPLWGFVWVERPGYKVTNIPLFVNEDGFYIKVDTDGGMDFPVKTKFQFSQALVLDNANVRTGVW